METVTECPLCGGVIFEPYLTCTDFLVSDRTFAIVECSQCHFRLTNPRPTPDTIGTYYQSEQYVSHNDVSKGVVDTAYRLVRNYTLRSKLSAIKTLNGGPGRVLDVGCGTGAFLDICQQHDWQVAGTEPDESARAIASQKIGLPVNASLNELPTTSQFDVITLWHVLEHIADLNTAVSTLHQLLTDEGTLLIAVPNCESYDAYHFGQFWAAYDLPRHLYHFTPATIGALFAKHGFRLLEQRPMLFDAYYIALLSNRNQTGSANYVSSARIGYASNTQAARTGNYSSLTYVLKKTG